MNKLTIDEARARDWPKIKVGESYEFHSELFEEYVKRPEDRMRYYTGQKVTVVRPLRGAYEPDSESDWYPEPEGGYDEDEPPCSQGFIVRAADGREFCALEEELTGWDKALGQFYGPSGIWGDPS